MAGKNVFGQSIWFKKKIFQTVGKFVRWYLLKPNKVSVSGSKVLTEIPEQNVLFIANHLTIFTVTAKVCGAELALGVVKFFQDKFRKWLAYQG